MALSPTSSRFTQSAADALYLAKALADAKGDLLAASAADTITRLAVGTDGHVLTADAAEATGVKWAAAGGLAFAGARVRKAAAQSIGTGAEAAITFDTEDFDTDAFHDNSTNPTRVTIPAGLGGRYLVGGVVRFASMTAGVGYAMLKVNGADYIAQSIGDAENSNNTAFTVVTLRAFSVGDYIELIAFQNSGGNVNAEALREAPCLWLYRVSA